MRVNQNISAVIANANLHHSENKLTASIERLSSGYKLNRAKDSPAAMAISNKMRAQIKGLDQSNKNAADGTSVMQTADGALNETHAMLQRMRELCVQAANGTMSISDKKACQNEIGELQEEIDRIAKDTEFNGKKILDGSQDYRAYPSVDGKLASGYIRNFQTSDEVPAEDYKFDITNVPKQATMDFTVTAGTAGTVEINGTAVKISATDSPDTIFAMLKEAGELVGVMVEQDELNPDNYKLTTYDYGKRAKISTTFTKEVKDKEVTAHGKDAEPAKTNLTVVPGTASTVDINGNAVTIEAGDNADAIYKKLQQAGKLAGVDVEKGTANNQYIFTTTQSGASAEIIINDGNGVETTSGKDAEPASTPFEVFPVGDPHEIHEVNINGCVAKIEASDTTDGILKKLQEAGKLAGVTVAAGANDTYIFTTDEIGADAKITIALTEIRSESVEGEDAQIKMVRDTDTKKDANGNDIMDANGDPVLYGEGFTNTATYLSDGKKVTIRDLNGFEMIFEVEPEMDTQKVMENKLAASGSVRVDLEMTDIGSMTLQIGTHENQIVDVRIPAATCEALYIDELNVVRKDCAEKAMRSLDDAIAQVSAIRSRIGAYQNRLDYAVTSLDGTEENMEAAISRIMDTDMAEEMSVYSNMNILDQAGISVLSQANDMPQQILQLLN